MVTHLTDWTAEVRDLGDQALTPDSRGVVYEWGIYSVGLSDVQGVFLDISPCGVV